jgi:hypothetical protein
MPGFGPMPPMPFGMPPNMALNPFMLQQLAMQNPALFQQFQAAMMQQAMVGTRLISMFELVADLDYL